MTEEQKKMAEKILKRWIEHPEELDELIKSLQEKPELWEQDEKKEKLL